MVEIINNLSIGISIILLILITLVVYSNFKLKKINTKLLKENLNAKKATEVKSNFIANISHEIRTPMNLIVGMTYLFQETNLNNIQKNYIKNIESASKNMLSLINQILDFSKLESNKLKLSKSSFSLAGLLNDVDNIVRYKAYNKELEFTIIYDKYKHLYFYSDSLKLLQILTNVISNAIKFTNHGFVELSIKELDKELFQFRVQDSGIGLSDEQINNIFDPFTQADEGTNRQYGGTGLGLSISQELVKLFGGNISVKSIIGKGSEFIIELPLKISDQTFEDIDSFEDKEQKEYIEKPTINDKEFEKLFGELKIAVSKRRPNLCEPIILKLNSYKLKNSKQYIYDKIVQLIRQYKFNEAKEYFNDK